MRSRSKQQQSSHARSEMKAASGKSIRRLEPLFLVATLLFYAAYSLTQWDTICGHDLGAYFQMLRYVTWSKPIIGLHACFYAYHPPLSFLLARSVMLTGFTPSHSVKIAVFIAAVIAFLALRSSLKTLNLLHTMSGVTFLYITSLIPLQWHLITCANLDVFILAYASLAMAISIRLFWCPAPRRQIFYWLALLFVLLAATMSKFSGFLIFALPILAALLAPHRNLRMIRRAIMLVLLAGVIVFPYYFCRYFLQTGSFFPMNSQWLIHGKVINGQKWRAAHPVLFMTNLFFGTPYWSGFLAPQNMMNVRLWNAWQDFWTSRLAMGSISLPLFLYIGAMAGLCIAGLVRFIRTSGASAWRRYGLLLVTFGAIFFASFIDFLLGPRFGGWGPSKGIYIAPALWGLGFLLAEAIVPLFEFFFPKNAGRAIFACIAYIALIQAFALHVL